MKRWVMYVLFAGVMSTSCLGLQKKTIQLSFDTIFPESAAKQLYDTMLQLWSDVTQLHDESLSDAARRDVADLISGELVRIQYLIEHMQTKNNNMLNNDDVRYLQSVANGLSRCFSSFFEQDHIKSLWGAINDGFASLVCD